MMVPVRAVYRRAWPDMGKPRGRGVLIPAREEMADVPEGEAVRAASAALADLAPTEDLREKLRAAADAAERAGAYDR